MYELAYLVVCYALGVNYHTGQMSQGYRLACLALERGRREHSALNVGDVWDKLHNKRVLYPKGGAFRKAVAFWLWRMRHQRNYL